jgi:hypothetical protein
MDVILQIAKVSIVVSGRMWIVVVTKWHLITEEFSSQRYEAMS